ncbi:hypothetical protein [Phenylobacterium sp.]|jgi:hypothetical protein|uniref:hypothetical protein n=1 Tax=Phenylobacterium sp. TaxID=1871053 RepID=UPI002F420E04
MTVKDEIDRTIASHPARVRAITLSARYWLEFCREIGAIPDRSFVRYSGYAAGDPPAVLILESWG